MVATWVVINCDKAQTRHTRNIHASLSLLRPRKRPCASAHPHAKRTRTRTRVCSADYGLRVRACAWARRSLALAGSRLENSAVAHELPRRDLECRHTRAGGPISGHARVTRRKRGQKWKSLPILEVARWPVASAATRLVANL